MAGNLGFDELKAAVKAGTIDTVLVAMVDMQGRLIGKRFQGEYFVDGAHKETHACDYLLANDIDMEPVPGYKAASWSKGYGDFVMKPDLSTLRPRFQACGLKLLKECIRCLPLRQPAPQQSLRRDASAGYSPPEQAWLGRKAHAQERQL